jgi:hypothetical protein
MKETNIITLFPSQFTSAPRASSILFSFSEPEDPGGDGTLEMTRDEEVVEARSRSETRESILRFNVPE